MMNDARVGHSFNEYVKIAPDDPKAARAGVQSLAEKSARDQGVADPEATARKVTGWPELRALVDAVQAYLLAIEGVTVERPRGKDKPRLVATVNGTRYGVVANGHCDSHPRLGL